MLISWMGHLVHAQCPNFNLPISPKTTSGKYSIVISDVSSCRSAETTNIYINGQGVAYLPTAFSPNGL